VLNILEEFVVGKLVLTLDSK